MPADLVYLMRLTSDFEMQKGTRSIMKRATLLYTCLILSAMLSSGCILDPKEKPPITDKPAPVWPDLTDKDDVFDYIELVYTQRKYDNYALLLDEDFNFRFGDDDYSSGKTDRDWGRTSELNSVNKLLNSYSHPTYGAVVQIKCEVFPQGQLWTEIAKNDPPYTGETWYQKSFNYRMTATTNTGMELRGNDIQAFFIVRQVEVEGKNIWRIVQWNDDNGL